MAGAVIPSDEARTKRLSSDAGTSSAKAGGRRGRGASQGRLSGRGTSTRYEGAANLWTITPTTPCGACTVDCLWCEIQIQPLLGIKTLSCPGLELGWDEQREDHFMLIFDTAACSGIMSVAGLGWGGGHTFHVPRVLWSGATHSTCLHIKLSSAEVLCQ